MLIRLSAADLNTFKLNVYQRTAIFFAASLNLDSLKAVKYSLMISPRVCLALSLIPAFPIRRPELMFSCVYFGLS